MTHYRIFISNIGLFQNSANYSFVAEFSDQKCVIVPVCSDGTFTSCSGSNEGVVNIGLESAGAASGPHTAPLSRWQPLNTEAMNSVTGV